MLTTRTPTSRRRSGVSVMEVIISMVIVGILAAFAVDAFVPFNKKVSSPSGSDVPTVPAAPPTAPADIPWGIIGLVLLGAVIVIASISTLIGYINKARRSAGIRAELAAVRERASTAHTDVKAEYGSTISNLVTLCSYPAYTDPTNTHTAAFLSGLAKAADAATGAAAHLNRAAVDNYSDAVSSLTALWAAAKSNARRIGVTGYAPEDQAKLRKARGLLKLAAHTSETAEAQAAARRAIAILETLMEVPEAAIAALETRVQHSITAGPAPTLSTRAGAINTVTRAHATAA